MDDSPHKAAEPSAAHLPVDEVRARVEPQHGAADPFTEVAPASPSTSPLDPQTAPAYEVEPLEAGTDKSEKPRFSPLHVAILAAALVAIAAGALGWWILSRQGAGSVSDVPRDAVAIINSSTPIALNGRSWPPDMPDGLSDPPESERWSGALREAHRAQEEGRYSAAISQYSALVGSGNSQEARDALWGLASAYAASGQRDTAIRAYSLFARLDDPRAVRALARMAQLHAQGGQPDEAIRLYEEYAKRGGPAEHAIRIMQARLMGNTPAAEKIYREVLNDNPQDVDMRQALVGLAEVAARSGNRAEARKVYDQLASVQKAQPRSVLDNVGIPPQVLAAGESLLALDVSGARARLLDYIEVGCQGIPADCHEYPYGRHLALSALVKLDSKAVVSGTIPPMLAAEIAYNAGRYGDAIGYLDALRVVSSDPSERAVASLLTGKAYEFSSSAASAYNWYTATVQTYPNSPNAPEAMRRAGDALEEQSAWDSALATYKEAIERFPNGGDETALARVHGGVLAYRLEQPDLALNWMSPLLSREEISATIRAEAAFWVGKLQKRAGMAEWKETLSQVSRLDPGSYLDSRARDIIAGEGNAGPLARTFSEGGVDLADMGVQYSKEAGERDELIAWAGKLAVTQEVVSGTTRTPTGATRPSSPATDPEAQRAMALLKLGYEDEAFQSFRALAERLQEGGDAQALAQLLLYARYHAGPRTALRVAERLTMLDGGDPTKRPRLLLKTLYPTPYGHLVVEEAKNRNVDPLIMYALLRQESQFVPGARSHADARGLAQVIPSTGEHIASQLGDSNFSVEDLYLPHVSVRYGTYYLATNLPQFDRKLIPALAAYNGGPGNAARWMAGSALLDPDLYTERIDFFETEDYVRRVQQNYSFYRYAYAP